jgi:uncharacterized protein YbjT (DUF2867 family)
MEGSTSVAESLSSVASSLATLAESVLREATSLDGLAERLPRVAEDRNALAERFLRVTEGSDALAERFLRVTEDRNAWAERLLRVMRRRNAVPTPGNRAEEGENKLAAAREREHQDRAMKVILFGATGMVGKGVLRQCLLDPEVESVLAIGRSPSGATDPKVRDLVRVDMFDTAVNAGELNGYDACFFCLGVSSVGMSEADYTRLTYDLTMEWARALARVNPELRFLYVSGMGTGGSMMWGRVKGRTENDLLALFPRAIMIRLGAMRPMHGERPKARAAAVLLTVLGPLWPVVQGLWPNGVITTEEIGRAMILAAREGGSKRVLENADLVALGRPKA